MIRVESCEQGGRPIRESYLSAGAYGPRNLMKINASSTQNSRSGEIDNTVARLRLSTCLIRSVHI